MTRIWHAHFNLSWFWLRVLLTLVSAYNVGVFW
jgi:hypothetical protein